MPSTETEEKKINGGYIYLARHILDSDIFLGKPAEWLKIWIYILLKVQYCNGRRSPRGTGYFNWEAEKENLPGVTKWQWHNCIRFLKKERMVATQKTTRGSLIKVLQYRIYQNPQTYRSKTPSNTETTHEQHTSNTILKRSKESKEKKRKPSCPNFSVWDKLRKKMEALILRNKPDYRFRGGKDRESKWNDEFRLMIEQDKRKPDRIAEVMEWALNNPFWRANILSPHKLRIQFDALELRMKNEQEEGGYGTSRELGKRGDRKGWKESEKYRGVYE